VIKRNKRVLKVMDNNHYMEEFYEERRRQDVKVRELDYERSAK